MTTFDEYIEATALYLSGFTATQDQVTYLTASCDASTLTLTVADGTRIRNNSLIEVGSELLFVESVSTNTITVAPFGRGYRGTTAAAHASNDKVTVSPTVPRSVIERAVNDSIRGVYPQVFGVGTYEFVTTQTAATYDMPAGFERALSVSREVPGPTNEWMPIRRFRVDQHGTTGATLSVYDAIAPGVTIRVVYSKQPVALVSGDNFTDCGLRDAAQDLVQFGAAARLTPWFEMGQAPGVSAEPNYAAAVGQSSQVVALSRFFTQMYQLRLAEEAQALGNLYPVRIHYTR